MLSSSWKTTSGRKGRSSARFVSRQTVSRQTDPRSTPSTKTSPSTPGVAVQDEKASSVQPDPMQPAIDSIEEMGRKDFGDRYNPKA